MNLQLYGITSDFATKVDLNGIDETRKQFCGEIYQQQIDSQTEPSAVYKEVNPAVVGTG